MELENILTNNLENEQNNFLNSTIGTVVNNAIDIGLRYVLPDLIEEEVIDVKDSLMQNGLKAGIKTAVENISNIGKSAIGILTGNFENISQIKKAVESGGVIDTISDVIDFATNKAKTAGIINSTVSSLIKSGKNTILENVSNSIEKELTNQEKNIQFLDKYSENWKEYFKNKDFDGMQKEYDKMKKKLKELIPIEGTLNKARTIETLHNLIKSKGKDFNLTEQELELCEKINQ